MGPTYPRSSFPSPSLDVELTRVCPLQIPSSYPAKFCPPPAASPLAAAAGRSQHVEALRNTGALIPATDQFPLLS